MTAIKYLPFDPAHAGEDGYLRDYQEETIQAALLELERSGGVLIGDGMGAGKTLSATEIVLRGGFERVLLIAIGDTIAQWAERIALQSDGQVQLRRMDSTKRGREAYADFQAGLAGHYAATLPWLTRQDFDYQKAVDSVTGEPIWKLSKGQIALDKKTGEPIQETERIHLKTFAKTPEVDAIVFDEFHAIQNKKSIGGRTAKSIRTKRRIGLSGTFHGNNFAGAWATCKWVWPGSDEDGKPYVDNSFHRWADEFCEMKEHCPKCFVELQSPEDERCAKCKQRFDRLHRPVAKVIGEKVPGQFVKTLPLYIRNEVFDAAPAPRAVYVDISPVQREQYSQLEQDLVAWVRDHEGIEAPLIADLPIVLRQRLRTATLGEMSLDADGEIRFADDCQSSKLVALRGVLDALDREAGRKRPAIIFTDSKRFARIVARRMQAAGYRAAEWTGDSTQKQRAGVKEEFLRGEHDYIVASIPSVAVGVDGLQHRASAIVWLSRAESELLNAQAEARVWRPGMTDSFGEFVQVDILANGTLDVGTFNRLAQTRDRNHRQMAA